MSLISITACFGSTACYVVENGGTTGDYVGVDGGQDAAVVVTSASFARSVQPLFVNSCVFGECHASGMPKDGVDLSEGKAIMHLVNVESVQCDDGRMLVLPGKPEKSYLIDKLKGQNLCFGKQMPYGDTPWPAADIQKVADWIAGGALNN